MTEIVLATLLLTALVLALSLFVMGARRIFVPSLPVEITVNGKTKVAGTTGELSSRRSFRAPALTVQRSVTL